ncbi:hypothetical protein G6038_15010 [Rhodococcus sp. 14C212]|nr:hypothetical protein [Rhodococcus sp. 14C212]NGP06767.1 hypothetical protein [Rhodococcus sp. 14C212]
MTVDVANLVVASTPRGRVTEVAESVEVRPVSVESFDGPLDCLAEKREWY